MEAIEIIKLALGSGGFVGIALLLFKIGKFVESFEGFKKEVYKRFDYVDQRFGDVAKRFGDGEKRFESIDKQLEMARFERGEIRKEIYEVRERLAFLEAETILYNTIPDENVRSEAAKRSWARRKAKMAARIEKK